MKIDFRQAQPEDSAFARELYLETMRWIIERMFGWDRAVEEETFARFFKLDEARIITADGRDVGWIQEQSDAESIVLVHSMLRRRCRGEV